MVGDQVFGTVPKALFRAVVESFALSSVQSRIYELDPEDGEDATIISNFRGPDASVTTLSTQPIEDFVPSMACPDCESLDSSYRSVPFSVTVTFKNAVEFRDWFVAGYPEQDCDWVADEIEARISAGADDADIDDYCTNLIGESNRLAKDRCAACGANLTKGQMFTTFESGEPRQRFLGRPNIVLYGPMLEQEVRRIGAKCFDDPPINNKLEYLDQLFGTERGVDTDGFCYAGESRRSYGVDSTFLVSSDTYQEENLDRVFEYYEPRDIVSGLPRGFSFSMGRSSTGRKYPIYWDVNLNRTQAFKFVQLLIDGTYFDDFTREVKLYLVTVNRQAKSQLVSLLEIRAVRREAGGVQMRWSVLCFQRSLSWQVDSSARHDPTQVQSKQVRRELG